MTIRPELTAIVGELDFDPDALHAKYLAERDKRLRTDGIGQYVEVTAEFSHYVDDPYVDPGFTHARRSPTRWNSRSSAAGSAAC